MRVQPSFRVFSEQGCQGTLFAPGKQSQKATSTKIDDQRAIPVATMSCPLVDPNMRAPCRLRFEEHEPLYEKEYLR